MSSETSIFKHFDVPNDAEDDFKAKCHHCLESSSASRKLTNPDYCKMYHRENSVMEEQCINSMRETLQFLNKEELQSIQDNEGRLNELINDLAQVKNLEDDKEALLASNKSIAEYNIGLQPRLAQEKAQLGTAYKTIRQLQEEFEETKQKLGSISGRQELDTTLALLQTEAAKSEEKSENTADSFLEGNQELEIFLPKYLAQRTETHARKIKVEKLQEIIRNSQSGHGYTSNVAAPRGGGSVHGGGAVPSYPIGNPAYSSGASSGWGSTPYPTNNSGMPQPTGYYNKR